VFSANPAALACFVVKKPCWPSAISYSFLAASLRAFPITQYYNLFEVLCTPLGKNLPGSVSQRGMAATKSRFFATLRSALQKLDALLVSIEQLGPSLSEPSSPRN